MHLIFKPHHCRIKMLLFRFFSDCFSLSSRSSFLKCYGTLFYVSFYVSFPVSFLKYCEQFCNRFKFKIWSCRVAGIYFAVIYSVCYYWKDDIPCSVGVHFGCQVLDKQMYLQTRSKCSRTWSNWHTIIITFPYIICRGKWPKNYGKYYLTWVLIISYTSRIQGMRWSSASLMQH